jgi:hypothetical protein
VQGRHCTPFHGNQVGGPCSPSFFQATSRQRQTTTTTPARSFEAPGGSVDTRTLSFSNTSIRLSVPRITFAFRSVIFAVADRSLLGCDEDPIKGPPLFRCNTRHRLNRIPTVRPRIRAPFADPFATQPEANTKESFVAFQPNSYTFVKSAQCSTVEHSTLDRSSNSDTPPD